MSLAPPLLSVLLLSKSGKLNFSSRTVRISRKLDNPRAFNQFGATALAVNKLAPAMNKIPVANAYTADSVYRNAYFGDSFMETWECLTIRF